MIVPVEAVKKSLQEAVLESSNKDELRKNVLQKIRNHFDIYEGKFEDVQREDKKSATISSLNKVGVKDVNEEELMVVLEKLKTLRNSERFFIKVFNKFY